MSTEEWRIARRDATRRWRLKKIALAVTWAETHAVAPAGGLAVGIVAR
jgi:hypothetical protein